MKTLKIYVTEPGQARDENNPHNDLAAYECWENNNPTTPAYTQTGEFLGLGEWDAVEVWQYEPQDEDYFEWRDCTENFYNNIIKCDKNYKNLEPTRVRRIFRAVIPQTTTTEENAVKSAEEDVVATASTETECNEFRKMLAKMSTQINNGTIDLTDDSREILNQLINTIRPYQNPLVRKEEQRQAPQKITKDGGWIRAEDVKNCIKTYFQLNSIKNVNSVDLINQINIL